jgi:hypothetical protein
MSVTEGRKSNSTNHLRISYSVNAETRTLCQIMWGLGIEALLNKARAEESASAFYHDVPGVLGPDGSGLHQRKADLQNRGNGRV